MSQFIFYYLFLLFLFSFSQESDLTKNLKYYETLHSSELRHRIVKRGVSESDHPYNKIQEIEFVAFRTNFRLILSPSQSKLFSKDFRAVEEVSEGQFFRIPFDKETFYSGRLFGTLNSSARAHYENGILTAKIDTPDETIHIEPSWRHLYDSMSSMIIYKGSDIIYSWSASPSVCASIKINDNYNESESRNKRDISEEKQDLKHTRCPLLLVADYRFFKEMGGGSSKTTVNYLISLIDRVHSIYEDTIWKDSSSSQGFSGMGFVIKKIVVHRKPTRVQEGEKHYNMEKSSWDVRNLLEVFSREFTHKDFCLAHLFTDIKFEGGILGLAYVGSPRRNSVGGICTPEYFKNGYTLYLNSGLSSSRNHYGQRVITREADLVTAHEFGHNWGSEHDPDSSECSPSASQGGSYLMYTYSVSGYDINNKKFSPCSLRFIRKVLLAKSNRCFSEPEESFCGNLRVEGEEECDAGLLGSDESDACCDENCKLRPSANCSDKNSPCCSGCEYLRRGVKCRAGNFGTCENEAFCSGISAICPPSSPMTDGTLCVEKGECRSGKCIPYCEILGKQSCMCDTESYACMRCCREKRNSSCYPIPDIRGLEDVLPDGTPCYQGFCNKGKCERTMQDVVERIWDFIEDFNINSILKFLKDNIVGAVVFFSLLIWIPISCFVSYIDKKRASKDEEEWTWKRQDELIHPNDSRRFIHIKVPRPSLSRRSEVSSFS